MEAAHIAWKPLGELFVARGLITDGELEEALAEQAAAGGRLGEILVKRNLISSPELTEALMEQLGREVAKEEGFGSGLWAEIQRRNARGDEPHLALVNDEEDRSPFGGALTHALGETADADDAEPIRAFETDLARTEPLEFADLKEMDELRRELDARDAAVETLSAELDQVRAELAAGSAELNEIDELRAQLADREHRLSELETEFLQLRAELEQKGSKPAPESQAEQELAAARREIGVRGARVAELEATLDSREHRIAELQQALTEEASLQGKVAELESERDAARDERDAAVAKLTPLDEQVHALQVQVDKSSTALGHEREAHGLTWQRAEETRQELDAKAARLAEFEAQVASLESRLEEADGARAKLSEMEDTVRSRNERMGELERLLDESASARSALESERDAVRAEHDSTASERDEIAASRAILEAHVASLQSQVEASSHAEHRVGDLEAALSARAERIDKLERLLDEARAAQVATAEFESERDAARAARDSAIDAMTSLEERVSRLQREVEVATGALERERGDHGAALQQVHETRSEVERLLAERDESEQRRAVELGEATRAVHEELRLAGEREAQHAGEVERLAELCSVVTSERDALDRRRNDLESRLAEESTAHAETRHVLSQALGELTGHEARRPGPEIKTDGDEEYLCFAPGNKGYRILTHIGVFPLVGSPYDIDGQPHVVTRVGRSPLPFDARRCAYLQDAS